jgi:hypothetical protein
MTTTRTPINRDKRRQFTPEIIAAFKVMERARLRCTCAPEEQDDECPACERWWRAHKIVHRGLRIPLWQYPAFEYPDRDASPEQIELYRALKEAADGH